MKRKRQANKVKTAIVLFVLSASLLVTVAVLAEENMVPASLAVVLTVVSMLFVIASVLFAAKVDYETGVYECRKCGHKFKPTFSEYFWGMHTLKKRYLTCHECGEKTWCLRKGVK